MREGSSRSRTGTDLSLWSIVERLQRDAATYKQLGNAVNAGAIYYALRTFLLDNLDDLPESLQDVAANAGLTPDIRQRPRTVAAPIVAPR